MLQNKMHKLNPIIIRTRKTKKESHDENKQIVLYKPKDRASLPSEKDLENERVQRHYFSQQIEKLENKAAKDINQWTNKVRIEQRMEFQPRIQASHNYKKTYGNLNFARQSVYLIPKKKKLNLLPWISETKVEYNDDIVAKPGSYWATVPNNRQQVKVQNMERIRAKSDFLNKYKPTRVYNELPKLSSREVSFNSDYLLPPQRILIFPH